MSESLEKNLAVSVHLSDADKALLEEFRDGVGCKHKAGLARVTAERDALRMNCCYDEHSPREACSKKTLVFPTEELIIALRKFLAYECVIEGAAKSTNSAAHYSWLWRTIQEQK